jgi:hypothetical protein
MDIQPLPLERKEVINAIQHRRPSRVPMMIHPWNVPEAFGDRAGEVRSLQARYPCDAHVVSPRMPQYWDDPSQPGAIPGYSWMHTSPAPVPAAAVAHDATVAITDWTMLDDMLARWPDPGSPHLLSGLKEDIAHNATGRYTIARWWYCFYERLWSLRGMENVLCDFYENPGPVHRLMDALCDFYCAVIGRCGRELGVDAVFTSDDIGMQTGPMFSPEIFREFFLPRYRRLIDTAHSHNMHFWLHTCGNVLAFLEDFIDIGLDVIHPIQKYTMDEREVARRFGGRIAFWAGMDLQQILPRGSTEEVRREVRFLIDTFDRPDGGCIITAGNGITADVPLENLEAFYDEVYSYGIAHRQRP